MKKLLAIALALVMVLSLFTGCAQQPTDTTTAPKSNDDTTAAPVDNDVDETTAAPAADSDLEPVTLHWYYPGEEGEGTDDVIKVFNEKLAEVLPNTTVEFTFVGSFDPYGEQWPLLLAGGEEMDIAWEGWNTPLLQDVKDGNVLPLTEYLTEETAPNLVKEMSIWVDDYDCVTYEGDVWAIPSIQPNSCRQSSMLEYHESMAECLPLKEIMDEAHANNKTTTKLFDLIDQGVQAAIDAGVFVPGDDSKWISGETLYSLGLRGYVRLDRSAHGGSWSNYYIDPEAEEPVVMHAWEIPEFQEAIKRLEQWRQKGWISEALAAGQLPDGAIRLMTHNGNPQGMWCDLTDEMGLKWNYTDGTNNWYVALTERPEQVYVGVSSFGYSTALVVPYTSKNPERAVMLIDLLRGEVGTVGNDLLNLLCYGFESTSPEAAEYGWANYTAVEEDGQLMTDISIRNGADAKHGMINWVIGNTFKTMHDGGTLTTTGSKAYAMEYWTEVYPNMPRCAISGLVTDATDTMDELENIRLIEEEYSDQIYAGAGYDLLEEALEKMNTNGLVEIKAIMQAQVDDYVG